jgi:trimethylamine--corrinoid protein Co-methyltransferase
MTSETTYVELVHESTLELLEEVGFCAPEKDLLVRLDRAGFGVNYETQMVHIPPDMVEAGLAQAPKDVRLYPRSGEAAVPGGRGPRFMGAGTPVNVLDLRTGEPRSATRADVRDLVRLQDGLPQVDVVRPTVTATDQGESSDLVEIGELLRGTSKPMVHRTLAAQRVDAAVEMLAAVAGGERALRARPIFATLYCPISPGYVTPENIRCMLRWVEHRVPLTLLSMAMGGASAPATLLGELVVINADILAWVVALQALYPGAPLLYGSVSSILDMRTGLLPLGAPERGMVNAGAAAMAQRYGLRSMCGGLSSDAKEVDAQAGFEKAVTAAPVLLQGADIIYGVGSVDAGSAISAAQVVLDNEFIGGLRRMVEGIRMHDLQEEIALVKDRTPKGNFLGTRHTRRAHKEHWRPEILSRETFDGWRAVGTTIADRCRERALDLLESHRPEPLPADVEAELERIVRRYQGQGFHFEAA